MEVDLRPVEGAVAGVELVLAALAVERLGQRRLGLGPLLLGAHRLLRPGRELDPHVLEAEARVELVDRLADVGDLVGDLLLGAVDVGVVLGEGAHAQQAVQDALALVAGDAAELGQAQRQLAVGVALGVEDEAGAGAVHRPQRQALLVGLHEVHVVAVVLPVPGAVPELLVEHLRRGDLPVAALAQLGLDLVLDQVQQRRAVGQPEGHPRRLFAQHEDAELGAEAAVVARLGLLDQLQVLVRDPS